MTPETLARLHADSFASPRPWTAAEFADLLASPAAFLLTEGEAFLLGRAAAGEAELLTLAVPPAQRRRGLGRRLLERFAAEARRRGAETAWLEVADDNRAARALYGAEGWVEAGRRPRYYARADAVPADAVVLRKPLGPALT